MTEQPFGQKIIAGDTWKWTVTLPDYPSGSYTLKYFFRGPSILDLVASPTGTADYQITASPSQTSPLRAGVYDWQAAVFDSSGSKVEIGRGQVEVLADVSAQKAGTESRSWVKITLDNVRAVLQGSAGRMEAEYQING